MAKPGPKLTREDVDRFWRWVPKQPKVGCWEWAGAPNRDGYGVFGVCQKGVWGNFKAHRISYSLAYGDIPTGLLIRHACDNPICVRPSHLSIGTAADNVADMLERGTAARGERCGSAKLSEQNVRDIRRLTRQGMSQQKIAEQFDINQRTVRRIKRRDNWAHVTDHQETPTP